MSGVHSLPSPAEGIGGTRGRDATSIADRQNMRTELSSLSQNRALSQQTMQTWPDQGSLALTGGLRGARFRRAFRSGVECPQSERTEAMKRLSLLADVCSTLMSRALDCVRPGGAAKEVSICVLRGLDYVRHLPHSMQHLSEAAQLHSISSRFV
jgi:hypothetical protein